MGDIGGHAASSAVLDRPRLIEDAMPFARRMARRMATRSGAPEDAEQAAMAGLVAAANRYDPSLGVPFEAFAGKTIAGELKRYRRDTAWAVRVPRRAQEHYLAVCSARDTLAGELGRNPTIPEIAAHLGYTEGDVLEAADASHALSLASLDRSYDDKEPLGAHVGSEDGRFGSFEDRHVVNQALARLPEREREVVRRYYFEGANQTEIAAAMGVSQMQVSRLLARSARRMHSWLSAA